MADERESNELMLGKLMHNLGEAETVTERDSTEGLSAGAICWNRGSTTGPFLF